MSEVLLATNETGESAGFVGKIPVANLWLLMLYASDLYRQEGFAKRNIEDNPEDIPDLIAEFLSKTVELRLMRNLSFGYEKKSEVLNRVRGRIDLFQTESHQLLLRGKVACNFDEFTINTPRNRYVRAALLSLSKTTNDTKLKHKCLMLAGTLERMGVIGGKPNSSAVNVNYFGRHDAKDKAMVTAAHLAFNLSLPTEDMGSKLLALPDREDHWARRLFEKAVAGFYQVNLSKEEWVVKAGGWLRWQKVDETSGISSILPNMQTDIVLDNISLQKRIVIDTKFVDIIKKGRFGNKTLSSGYLYQIYAYIQSQTNQGDELADNASGILLHPAVNEIINESVVIQGHSICFVTVDLATSAIEIKKQLIEVLKSR